MFLKSLQIIKSNKIIRDIPFQKGLNLIVDETPTDESNLKKSGNNVGKTTVIRLIDFCLGGDAKNIYQDPEFKNRENKEVKNFLMQNDIIISLTLSEDLDNESSKKVTICRNFLQRKNKLITINGKDIPTNIFDQKLKEIFFNFTGEKPTFKQIKAKNIRDEDYRLSNTVKVLGNLAKDEEYEALYLFWLGIISDESEEKRKLLEDQKLENKILNRLLDDGNESKYQQSLEVLQRKIDFLEKKKDTFNFNDKYEEELNRLNKVRLEINKLNNTISRLELRKELIEESEVALEDEKAKVNLYELKMLYQKANSLIPNLQKSFEETVVFHNKMIKDRIRYIKKELPQITFELNQIKTRNNELLELEETYSNELRKGGVLEDLEAVIIELNELYEEKGNYQGQLNSLIKSRDILTRIDSKLGKIDQGIEKFDDAIQEKIKKFNKYFSEISNNLYNEHFILSADFVKKRNSNNKFYKLSIDSLHNRAGTGKKKGEIAAFDLAYIKFADSIGLSCFHFILHDQMEVVHANQIRSLLKEVSTINCQLVVPILRDKLPTPLLDKKYEILSLSQDDKLFRIEHYIDN